MPPGLKTATSISECGHVSLTVLKAATRDSVLDRISFDGPGGAAWRERGEMPTSSVARLRSGVQAREWVAANARLRRSLVSQHGLASRFSDAHRNTSSCAGTDPTDQMSAEWKHPTSVHAAIYPAPRMIATLLAELMLTGCQIVGVVGV